MYILKRKAKVGLKRVRGYVVPSLLCSLLGQEVGDPRHNEGSRTWKAQLQSSQNTQEIFPGAGAYFAENKSNYQDSFCRVYNAANASISAVWYGAMELYIILPVLSQLVCYVAEKIDQPPKSGEFFFSFFLPLFPHPAMAIIVCSASHQSCLSIAHGHRRGIKRKGQGGKKLM